MSVAHVVRQAVPAVLQVYAPQELVPLSTHVPVPLHRSAVDNVLFVQLAARQTVEAGYWAQAPAPPHKPLVPQDAAPSSEHSSSGSVPAAMFPHVPSAPEPFLAAEHAWQAPPHAVLQHTPSVQLPLAHWAEAVQTVPSTSFAAHTVPLQ